MTQTETAQAISQILGFLIAALVAGWVRVDARRRGFSLGASIGWSVGVFLILLLFLPLYLWVRRNHPLLAPGAAPSSYSPIATVPCPYCGYENNGDPNYCAKCGRQLRSSLEIHK